MDAQDLIAAKDARIAEQDARIAEQDARIAEQRAQIAELERQVAQLLERLGRNSGNSNQPPSSDAPGAGARRSKKSGKRKRGGQKGHRGSRRELLPPEKVDDFVELFPPECESCWKPLPQVIDCHAKRYQHTELRPLAAHVTEYRRHAVVCPCCGYKTRAAYDSAIIPRFAFGPRLMAVVAMLTGVYHLSRRQTVRLVDELLGVKMSLGSVSAIEARVSEAVEPAVEEVWASAREAPVKHADGTSWRRSGKLWSLWVVATRAVTAFMVLANGRMETLLNQLFGGRARGILVSDRATALKFWAMKRRQICWAHLIRKFVSFAERDGPAGLIGEQLLEYASLQFDYWARFKNGALSRAQLIDLMAPVRLQVEALLERAALEGLHGLSGSCADILEHREALWTYALREGVEPTNNHGERELRAIVLWRRRSFGSQSERGDHFATRMMTIAHTARKQGRAVLDFLVACCRSATTPSLLQSS